MILHVYVVDSRLNVWLEAQVHVHTRASTSNIMYMYMYMYMWQSPCRNLLLLDYYSISIFDQLKVLYRIGQFLLASATSGFSSYMYIKLAYCSSAQELQ